MIYGVLILLNNSNKIFSAILKFMPGAQVPLTLLPIA